MYIINVQVYLHLYKWKINQLLIIIIDIGFVC